MEQRELAKEMKAFHDFRFTDEFETSGITFQHHITEDSGKNWKPVHYDHGSGVAVADVDGDGILDVYFLTQIGSNELWRGLGNGRLREYHGQRLAWGLKTKVSVAAAFGDIDNDGDPDLFVSTVKMGNQLFENDGSGRFTDISESAGVDASMHSSGSIFFDHNNDGLLDLYVGNVGVYTTDAIGTDGFYLAVENGFIGHTMPERFEKSLFYRNLGGQQDSRRSANPSDSRTTDGMATPRSVI